MSCTLAEHIWCTLPGNGSCQFLAVLMHGLHTALFLNTLLLPQMHSTLPACALKREDQDVHQVPFIVQLEPASMGMSSVMHV